MTPATINTILNTAPMIIQGATKLINLIRDRADNDNVETLPDTVAGLKQGINSIEKRLDVNDESNVEQIKLIEELARQNEAMAESFKKAIYRINILAALSIIALLTAGIAIYLASG